VRHTDDETTFVALVLVAVTDHAVERYRQRVARGAWRVARTLDARTEIAARVGEAWAAGSVSRSPRRFTEALKRGERRGG
jgi:hypothetical protein